ncbi:MAG: uracil-DNA glycosylase family protein [Pseudomonadota bacterium]
MTETTHHYSQILDWYRACGVDAVLSDAPRNHYVATTPVKLSFKRTAQPVVPVMQSTTPSQAMVSIHTLPTMPSTPEPVAQPGAITQSAQKPASPVKAPVFSAPVITSGDHPALTCETLDQLRYAMEHATGCDLIKAATHTVFSDGNPTADVMLIGEAPGADEDRLGQPFVGQSGQLLDTILATIGLDRNSIYISNIIPWRPPGNRPPTTSEIAYCLPFIKRHIELVAPKILILLGGVAVKTLLNRNDGILKLRGEILEYATKDGNAIAAMPTLHPSYIMRSPSQKALVWKDMLTLKTWLARH